MACPSIHPWEIAVPQFLRFDWAQYGNMWWMKDKNVKCLCLVNYALFILLWISKAICASFYSSQQFYIRYGGCCHMLCLIHADKFWSLPYCFTHHSIFHGHFHDVHTVFLSRLKKKVTAWIETKISFPHVWPQQKRRQNL